MEIEFLVVFNQGKKFKNYITGCRQFSAARPPWLSRPPPGAAPLAGALTSRSGSSCKSALRRIMGGTSGESPRNRSPQISEPLTECAPSPASIAGTP